MYSSSARKQPRVEVCLVRLEARACFLPTATRPRVQTCLRQFCNLINNKTRRLKK